MPAKIDKIDKKIVDLLLSDGRMSSSDIARALENVSERSVRYRLERLLREKIIQICAIVQPAPLGYAVIGDVFVEVEPGQVHELAQKMTTFENVSYVASSIGDTDISIQVVAKDNAALYAFVTQVIGKLPGVRKTTTQIVPYKLKDVYQWGIPESIVNPDSPE